jgi:hypothetical protein
MEDFDIIKQLDANLKKFVGDTNVDAVFADPKRYRRLADQFWNTKVVKPSKAA